MIELIIHCLSLNYGISAAQLTPLSLGADMDAFVYRVETKSDQSYFVKLKRGANYDIGVVILDLLKSSGMEHIIAPVKTKSGDLSQPVSDFTLTVYPFVSGQNGFSYKLNDSQWINLGKLLRQLHKFDLPAPIKNLIRKEDYSDKWRNTVKSLYSDIDENLNDDEVALKMRLFMKEHKRLIHDLLDRAEVLGQKVRESSPQFVLCHSDIHAGNVLINDKGFLFIVDWDDPIMAPKERDLMFIGGGVGNVWNDLNEEECFYKGYGNAEINQLILAYYRYERIVEDIAEYGQALLLTRNQVEDREKMFKQFKGMFERNGVVEIALKTDIERKDANWNRN
jgi:spectinomycin phosphotransferase